MVDGAEPRRTAERESMRYHPDVVELQRQYGGALGSPRTVLGDGVLALAGVWAAVSPFVIGLSGVPALATHHLVIGLVVAGIGLGVTGMAERGGGLSWVAAPLGIWLIISTWIVPAAGPTAGLVWSNVIAGAVMVIAGAGVAAFAMAGTRSNSE
ncbi:SPW repeat protein [Salinifilum ghardaiensis]